MNWPKLWVFVRHAESEGNVLTKDERAQMPKSSHLYELTERGRQQAAITGAWLQKRFGEFDIYYSSYYTRTRQTLDILYPGVTVYEDSRLAEVQRGIYHVLTEEEMAAQFPFEIERRRREGDYHYRPIGGESWADVELKAHSYFGTVARDCSGLSVLTVTHGNWLVIARKLIHHTSIDEALREFREDHTGNASVTIYRGVEKNGKARLELEAYNIIPWEGKL